MHSGMEARTNPGAGLRMWDWAARRWTGSTTPPSASGFVRYGAAPLLPSCFTPRVIRWQHHYKNAMTTLEMLYEEVADLEATKEQLPTQLKAVDKTLAAVPVDV
ncbi:hypothetical protein JB92DRAFT_2829836 [Gautieria morchelliformis]|nr:hypothetical protein JB92DRAFT_2829836 [Gautieria morchelliformis]